MTEPTVDAERRAAEVLAEHDLHCGAGGNLWNAKCLGCDWRDGGRATIEFAYNAHAAHVAAMLAQAGVLADAQHDAEVAAKALRDAADHIETDLPGSDAGGYYASEHHAGYDDAARDAEAWLRARAERTGPT